jgi:hypothetical protein
LWAGAGGLSSSPCANARCAPENSSIVTITPAHHNLFPTFTAHYSL